MVMRTFEIIKMSFEVEKEKQEEVIKKIKGLYPNLEVLKENDNVTVRGDLRNYKRRLNLIYILTEGKHGKSIQAC